MKGSRTFNELEEKPDTDDYWNDVYINPLCENEISVTIKVINITLDNHEYNPNTKSTSKTMSDGDKSKVYNLREKIGFYIMTHTKELKSVRVNIASKVSCKSYRK